MSKLDSVLEQLVVRDGVAPGATACVAQRHPDGWSYCCGRAGVRSAFCPDAVLVDSIYDLASLTKPVLALCLGRLHDRGVLSLDDQLGEVLPLCRDTFAGRTPLELLLAHRAGLEAHLELFGADGSPEPADRETALLRAARAARPDCSGVVPVEGFAPVYSDLGYLLLGAVVEAATGRDLDAVIVDELAQLGLDEIASARVWTRALSSAGRDFATRVVPTEVVARRGGEVCGIVHDDNAHALSGLGASGHAGLFGTARGMGRFGAALLEAATGSDSLLARGTVERLLRPRPGGALRAGFDGKSATSSSVGSRLGSATFGHLGFTGTSLWCDPESGWLVVVLCNRVSPTRDNPLITKARPQLHDALLEAAGFP